MEGLILAHANRPTESQLAAATYLHLHTDADPFTSAQVLTPLTSTQVLSLPSPPHRCCNWEVVAKEETQRPFLLQVPTLHWNLTSCLQSEAVWGEGRPPLTPVPWHPTDSHTKMPQQTCCMSGPRRNLRWTTGEDGASPSP